MRDDVVGDVAAERQLNVIKGLLAVLPRNRGFRIGADLSISVYPASPRARLLAAKQGGSPRLSKRESCSEQGGKRAATNARTRRSAARAAKHAERRAQAEIRLQELACKMAKVLRWKSCQAVWTAFMRDRTIAAPSSAQPAPPAPAPASPPPPAPKSADVRMRSPSAEKRLHTPDSRPSKTPATPPSAPKTKRRKPGAVAAALAAAATPQAHTATSEAAPDRRAASPRSPTLPSLPPTSPPSASGPALPARASHRPETNIPSWGRECRPPQGSYAFTDRPGRGNLAWE